MEEKLLLGIAAIAAFCAYLVRYTLGRAAQIEDSALARWAEQTEAFASVKQGLDQVGDKMQAHDVHNARAHKQAADIMTATVKLLQKGGGKHE